MVVSGPDEPRADLAPTLEHLGLSVGDRVRFRRGPGRHWHEGVVQRLEADGSVGLQDDKRAARAIPWERLEVRVPAPHGGHRWRPVSAGVVASRHAGRGAASGSQAAVPTETSDQRPLDLFQDGS